MLVPSFPPDSLIRKVSSGVICFHDFLTDFFVINDLDVDFLMFFSADVAVEILMFLLLLLLVLMFRKLKISMSITHRLPSWESKYHKFS
jgi:hypothetical protein